MKYIENIQQVAELNPDYLGFIFYDRSPRNFEGIIPELPKEIKKAGVFVNEIPEILVSLVEEYGLKMVQLHGDESPDYILRLKEMFKESIAEKHQRSKYKIPELVKVFSIKDDFNFETVKSYEELVDYFLFDTKGNERGGNGITFNWKLLENYNSTKPFFLSGGIGSNEVTAIKELQKTSLPIYALDINSKFETEAGLKSVKKIKKFRNEISTN